MEGEVDEAHEHLDPADVAAAAAEAKHAEEAEPREHHLGADLDEDCINKQTINMSRSLYVLESNLTYRLDICLINVASFFNHVGII